ncbi:MAG: heme exporter protein CcmB [Bacteroidetes bacterium]|nr:heme exporter protein CcmB [Bacteroidota bacterium]
MSEITFLIKKEILLEWKQKYAFNGLLLYVISTVFVCYLSFKQIVDLPTWNALFWIIQLFAGVNAIAKSFLQESRGRMLYYYTIADPRSFILSRIIYNFMLMMVISGFNLLFYSLFIGNPVQDMPMFILAMVLGSTGFSAVLSMVSAIAAKAGNNFTLMSILSFPILLPLLMVTIRFSKNALDGLAFSVSQSLVIMLLGFIAMIVAMAYMLFPYLWRE